MIFADIIFGMDTSRFLHFAFPFSFRFRRPLVHGCAYIAIASGPWTWTPGVETPRHTAGVGHISRSYFSLSLISRVISLLSRSIFTHYANRYVTTCV